MAITTSKFKADYDFVMESYNNDLVHTSDFLEETLIPFIAEYYDDNDDLLKLVGGKILKVKDVNEQDLFKYANEPYFNLITPPKSMKGIFAVVKVINLVDEDILDITRVVPINELSGFTSIRNNSRLKTEVLFYTEDQLNLNNYIEGLRFSESLNAPSKFGKVSPRALALTHKLISELYDNVVKIQDINY